MEVWRFRYVLRTQCERDQLFLGDYDITGNGNMFALPFAKGGMWPEWRDKPSPVDLLGFKPFYPFGQVGWLILKQHEYVIALMSWRPGEVVPVTYVFVCPARDDKGYAMTIFRESGSLRDSKRITCLPNFRYDF